MASPRVACAGCGRSIAVVSNAGRLARHQCTDLDTVRTPAGELALARQREAALRARITLTEASIAAAGRLAGRARAARWAAWPLVAANLILIATVGPNRLVGAFWLAIAALAFYAWRGGSLSRSALERDRRTLDRQREHYAAAHADMLELEAGLPTHLVWPELYPTNPEDTPS